MPIRPNFATRTRRLLTVLFCLLGSTLAVAQADPPGRVARLSHVEGRASFALEGSGVWSPAEFNRPLTTGDQVAADAGSRVELHSGSTALRLDGRTRLVLTALDDDTTRIQLSEGTLAMRIRALYPGERYEVNTANLAFVASQPGEYRIDVDPTGGTTRVTLHNGSGVAYGERGEARTLVAPQQLVFIGRQLGLMQLLAAAPRDAFDLWVAERDRREDQSQTARYVSREIPGYHQLDAHGDWSSDPVYGSVWLPRVTIADWAPYRYGQWRWIAPWGWTWVDDAPWGFAPFHYGRWIQVGLRWAWVPGPVAPRPIYAPALVGFIGLSGGGGDTRWSVSLGTGGAGIGWFPLAPGDVWRPAYTASPRYLDQINRWPQRRDERSPASDYRYRQHPGALTVVPADDFGQRRSNRPGTYSAPQRVPESELSRTQVLPPPPRTAIRNDGRSGVAPASPPPAARPAPRMPEPQAPVREFGRPRESQPMPPAPQRREEPFRQQEEPSRALPPRQVQPQAPMQAPIPVPPQVQPQPQPQPQPRFDRTPDEPRTPPAVRREPAPMPPPAMQQRAEPQPLPQRPPQVQQREQRAEPFQRPPMVQDPGRQRPERAEARPERERPAGRNAGQEGDGRRERGFERP